MMTDPVKQNQIAFLNWLKSAGPAGKAIYTKAVKRAMTRTQLGALGDDLIQAVGVDDTTLTQATDTTAAQAAVNQAAADTSSSGWGDLFSNIASAVSQIAPTVVQTQAQLSTISLNAQRAQQGLPPLGFTSLLTGQGLSSLSPTVLMMGLAVIGGVLLLSKKRG